MNNKDNQFRPGAIPVSRVRRYLHRKLKRRKFARGTPFDWNSPVDARDRFGPLPLKNQGSNSSCSGQAGSVFLQVQRLMQGVAEGEISAKSVYAPIAYKGGGTTVSALITQLCTRGGNLESAVPSYDQLGNPLGEIQISDRSFLTVDMRDEAESRAGYTPYDLDEDIDEVAAAIRDYGAVIWEIAGQNGNVPGWQSATPQPPSKSNTNPVWYHFMVAVGARMVDGRKTIVALQSEGPFWGEHGVQYFGEDYFKSGYMIDCFTLIYDRNIKPLPTNHSIWAEVLRWYRMWKWRLGNAVGTALMV